ncbi:hypothetical protein LTR47_011685 [Exophiala xenobiotica]|nr:hypothetical protein LTR47_011685 [Exophiala xenobiotica]KAK5243510.1 hypothetical protein LTS06_010749 [Exophiala xenobiotica]KAK5260363.1 hypothetical protein LTR40_004291 [Exophiala xenobiotica]KAK5344626.1 hypothetical protein LTR61_011599 [Exophiala xenobiotica]KAK5357318.1 hypothetical protein LTS03_011634 [Exophiala xenobiotica]
MYSKTIAGEEETKQERCVPEDKANAVKLSNIAEDLLKLQEAFNQSDSVFLNTPGRKVFRLEDVVFKFGRDVEAVEAATLRYMAEETNIPVPGLYRDCIHSDGTVVIAMEYVEGRILSDLWLDLRHDMKMNICGQLRYILEEMRCLQRDVIGGIGSNPAVDTRKSTLKGGPFYTERQFNEFLRSDLKAPKTFRLMLEETMKENHNIVLAHGDISPRNIVVNDGQIVAILDWECAGWYPEYWDFVKFFNALDPELDWSDYDEEIFPKRYSLEKIIDNFLDLFSPH